MFLNFVYILVCLHHKKFRVFKHCRDTGGLWKNLGNNPSLYVPHEPIIFPGWSLPSRQCDTPHNWNFIPVEHLLDHLKHRGCINSVTVYVYI